jgi:hypothetical protein
MPWAYEGIECYVSAVVQPNYVPIYRAWNGSDHFYTSSESEYNGLPVSYQREGISCYIGGAMLPAHVPLFRLYKAAIDDHFYCISVVERNNAVSTFKYTYEGIVGYVLPSESPGHVPLYRALNPEIGDHFYTTNVVEIDNNGPSLSRSKLENLLKSKMSGYFLSSKKLYFADQSYFCPTEAVAQQIIDACKVDQKSYISEIFDCDDFAYLLKVAFIGDAYDGGRRSMPYAFGIVWGNKPAHAMNFLVTSDGKDYVVRLVEPQTGTVHALSLSKLKEIYLLVA